MAYGLILELTGKARLALATIGLSFVAKPGILLGTNARQGRKHASSGAGPVAEGWEGNIALKSAVAQQSRGIS